MKATGLITILDPSLKDNSGIISDNLGDVIIYDSVKKIIAKLFPSNEVVRISSHQWFTQKEKTVLKESLLTFVGGSNLLSSDIRHFHRFTPEKKKGFYLFPGFNNIVLLGTGWYRYQPRPDWATTIYFNRVLNKKYFQSLRDNFTLLQLKKAFIPKLLNTCCPTTWELDPAFINTFQPRYDKILFTLNNNYPSITADNNFIKVLLSTGSKDIYFFPQVAEDKEYLNSLAEFKANKFNFIILPHRYDDFVQFTHNNQFNYIGTRLHAGIYSLQRKMPAMIIGVDNRAIEIKKDTNLNVISREDSQLLQNWIQSNYDPGALRLPLKNIDDWKNQFLKKDRIN